jgi:GNAT superfamily N-acetyltransferase
VSGPLTNASAKGTQFRQAGLPDAEALASLRWEWRSERYPDAPETFDQFRNAFVNWWAANVSTHLAYVLVDADEIVGMAWLALLARVPDPGKHDRKHADLQSVYVRAEYRNRGLGTELIRYAIDQARALGCDKVSVHSGNRAQPLYVRAGFVAHDRLLELDLSDAG